MTNRACSKRKEPAWRPIPGARRYDASDTGLVREASTGRVLTPTASGRNSGRLFHLTVSLVCDDGKRRNKYVHQLVLLAHARRRSSRPDRRASPGSAPRLPPLTQRSSRGRTRRAVRVCPSGHFDSPRRRGCRRTGETP